MSLELLSRYPWHENLWNKLDVSRQLNRFHHALLLWGQKGLGKKDFGQLLVKSLLCHSESLKACNLCQGCHWFNKGVHPDFITLEPLKGKKNINVEQIRQLQGTLSLSRSAKTPRVILIPSAEKMNISASNALLKSLEEPLDNTVYILISEGLSALPVTIQSRCKKIFFSPLSNTLLKCYLEKEGLPTDNLSLLSGSPLLAKDYLSEEKLTQRKLILDQLILLNEKKVSPCQTVLAWSKVEDFFVLRVLYEWFTDLIKITNGLSSTQLINNKKENELKKFLQSQTKDRVFTLIDKLVALMEHLSFSRQVNVALWLDDLAIDIAHSN